VPLSLEDEITTNHECFSKRIARREISAWRQLSSNVRTPLLDDLAEMFINRRMRTIRHGREALALDQLKHQEQTDSLATCTMWSSNGACTAPMTRTPCIAFARLHSGTETCIPCRVSCGRGGAMRR
jgi:hypothetical protein